MTIFLLNVPKSSTFGTMITCKLKSYFRRHIYISLILASYITVIAINKIKWSTIQKKSLLWIWSKCKMGQADPESSWHNCISLDWLLMLIALMEWNQMAWIIHYLYQSMLQCYKIMENKYSVKTEEISNASTV